MKLGKFVKKYMPLAEMVSVIRMDAMLEDCSLYRGEAGGIPEHIANMKLNRLSRVGNRILLVVIGK